MIELNKAGTAGNSVTRCFTTFFTSSAMSRGFACRISCAPPVTGQIVQMVRPKMWNIGNAVRMTSCPGSKPVNQAVACCTL